MSRIVKIPHINELENITLSLNVQTTEWYDRKTNEKYIDLQGTMHLVYSVPNRLNLVLVKDGVDLNEVDKKFMHL